MVITENPNTGQIESEKTVGPRKNTQAGAQEFWKYIKHHAARVHDQPITFNKNHAKGL